MLPFILIDQKWKLVSTQVTPSSSKWFSEHNGFSFRTIERLKFAMVGATHFKRHRHLEPFLDFSWNLLTHTFWQIVYTLVRSRLNEFLHSVLIVCYSQWCRPTILDHISKRTSLNPHQTFLESWRNLSFQ